MRYQDLIQFEPIETVIELRVAEKKAQARRLVETFVISDRMAEQLTELVIPQLQFLAPKDSKGLFVVGNYGTGKSHLMAVISAIAEHPEMAGALTNDGVGKAAAKIAGQFVVARTEIGATEMGLRDIILGALERRLDDLGIAFTFPAASAVSNNKDPLIAMMAAFQAEHPEKGLLLVVDELLDYLRTRRDQALILDLNFLRELGEVVKTTRFRFIAGVQETLFDNPRFAFVAETLRRVQDRFQQIRIARQDVAYVVAERLLRKDATQRAWVREHLEQFAPLYETMTERMDDFVRLYPIHPSFLDTFEQMYVAEKREVLKTISSLVRGILNETVPADATGVISYDSYWTSLTETPAFRSVPEIREVIDKTSTLEHRIEQAFPTPRYKPTALRLIHALAVRRLAVGDIHAPIGATAEELRDSLCLILPVPEKEAGFLKSLVEKVLSDILKTVNGQFLSRNAENGQYYLDLSKDVDYDALVAQRAQSLELEQLDRYYNQVLTRVIECSDQTYVSGYDIWEHEVEWRERKAGRSGYLFFGTPNQRSTASPPRDFYLFFVQPYAPQRFTDDRRPDEVFFRLVRRDDAFDEALRHYAGALELALSAASATKKIYSDKAETHLRTLVAWLTRELPSAVEVTHEGRTKTLGAWIQGKVAGGERPAPREQLNLVASVALASHFESTAPEYPKFEVRITRENRAQNAQDAIRWLTGGIKSKVGTAVLDALELLDGDRVDVRRSRYARQVLDVLAAKGPLQVLNRSELVVDHQGVDYWMPFRIEPEFLAVVISALVLSGDLVVSLMGAKLDAGKADQLGRTKAEELAQFHHVERPRDLPLAPLQALFELLELPTGLVVNPNTREQAVTQAQNQVAVRLNRTVTVASRLEKGVAIWGTAVFSDAERDQRRESLGRLKVFLESLQPYNSVGKLKNFPYDVDAVQSQRAGLETLGELEELQELSTELGPVAAYLAQAEGVLPTDHAWVSEMRQTRDAALAALRDPARRALSATRLDLTRRMAELQKVYLTAYVELHSKHRLSSADDQRKAQLNADTRLQALRRLRSVEMMPAEQLRKFEDDLLALKSCFALVPQDLTATPVCPHCSYRPATEGAGTATAKARLNALDGRLDRLLDDWTGTLRDNLGDPTVAPNLDLLPKGAVRKSLESLAAGGALPEPVDDAFVRALREVLGGLQKVTVTQDALSAALADGGLPCTIEQARDRLILFLDGLAAGRDRARVRLVIE
jgi:Family of unknown function (DUF6079)